jgi:hypothetical protein
MNDLLKLAVEAHAELDRWNKTSSLKAKISVMGTGRTNGRAGAGS